jgi:hypothetical protein
MFIPAWLANPLKNSCTGAELTEISTCVLSAGIAFARESSDIPLWSVPCPLSEGHK